MIFVSMYLNPTAAIGAGWGCPTAIVGITLKLTVILAAAAEESSFKQKINFFSQITL